MDMVSQWVSKKVTEYLGYEDDIVSNYVVSQLKLAGESGPKPKEMQLFLTGNLTTIFDKGKSYEEDIRVFGGKSWGVYEGAVEAAD